jgi:hypothetical protein
LAKHHKEWEETEEKNRTYITASML